MARYAVWALAALLLVPAGATAAQQGPPQGKHDANGRPSGPTKWWADEKPRAELGISDQQSALIEQVWQKSIPQLRELRQKLDDMEAVLSHMIRDAVDEPSLIAEIDKVEAVRAEANKARTLMLYRMNRVLSPEQRDKLKAMWDRMEAARRGPGDHRRP
jgi:Spy/CpxP family protein refolding chaperone